MTAPWWLLAAVVHAAPTSAVVVWAGHLEDDDGPVSRPVSAVAVVRDAASGAVVGRVDEPTLLVVDGDFLLDVPVPVSVVAAGSDAAPGDPVAAVAAATVELVVNGVVFPPFSVGGAWPRVAHAAFALRAEQVLDVDAVEGIADPVALDDLAAGAVAVAFANVIAAPADFLDDDGDGGLAFEPDASFSFVDGTLALVPGGIPRDRIVGVDAADLADNSVSAVHVASSAVTTADLQAGSVPLSDLAEGAVGAAHLGTLSSRVELFEIDLAGCDGPVGTLTTTPKCDASSGVHNFPSVGFAVFR